MTNETEAREYFIMKRGYYYRPDNCGYTDRPILAGLYTEAEAKATTHPNGEDGPRDGMHYFHKSKCKDADYVAYNAQAARIAELEAERDEQVQWVKDLADDVVRLEAKLAKAVDVLGYYAWENEARLPSEGPWGVASTDFGQVARATLAELKGTDT